MTESPIDTHMRLIATSPEYQERIDIYDAKFEEIKDHFKRNNRNTFSLLLCHDVIERRIEELEDDEPESFPNELFELKRFMEYLDL